MACSCNLNCVQFSNCKLSSMSPRWWLNQPNWNILGNFCSSFPQVRVKIENTWNHQLVPFVSFISFWPWPLHTLNLNVFFCKPVSNHWGNSCTKAPRTWSLAFRMFFNWRLFSMPILWGLDYVFVDYISPHEDTLLQTCVKTWMSIAS